MKALFFVILMLGLLVLLILLRRRSPEDWHPNAELMAEALKSIKEMEPERDGEARQQS